MIYMYLKNLYIHCVNVVYRLKLKVSENFPVSSFDSSGWTLTSDGAETVADFLFWPSNMSLMLIFKQSLVLLYPRTAIDLCPVVS